MQTPSMNASQEIEQGYFDEIYSVREEKRLQAGNSFKTAGNAKDRAALAKIATSEEVRGGPNDAVAFERIDLDDGECFYVGLHTVHDLASDIMVYSWHSKFVQEKNRATPQDPQDVIRKRQFKVAAPRSIIDMTDTVYAELLEQLEELERQSGSDLETLAIQSDGFLQAMLDGENNAATEMQNIARTIQASQMELIRNPADQLLILQGGPGTGKTAVALHRVSWLLENYRSERNDADGFSLEAQDIAIVGPNPIFKKYIKDVLPILGDADVPQFFTDEFIYKSITTARRDTPLAGELKGSLRMTKLLRQGVRRRIRLQDDSYFSVKGYRWKAEFSKSDLENAIEGCGKRAYRDGREAFRIRVTQLATDSVKRTLKTEKRGFRGDPSALLNSTEITDFINKVWPTFSGPEFLNDLFSTSDRLIDADSSLSGLEVRLLQRQKRDRLTDVEWTVEDLPLLDYVDFLLYGNSDIRDFKHIVIDEAQDLSAMQLEAIKRRNSEGFYTLVGDLAQITAPLQRSSWDDVSVQLSVGQTISEKSLRHGYRVPQQPMEVAAALLQSISETLSPPIVIRKASTPPSFHSADTDEVELGRFVCERAQQYASKGLFLGIVVSDSKLAEVTYELNAEGVSFSLATGGQLSSQINVLTPEFAKGLEFQALLVVDPSGMVQESENGLKALYIALTRTTNHLEVIFEDDKLPTELLQVAQKYGYTPRTGRSAIENETPRPQEPVGETQAKDETERHNALMPAGADSSLDVVADPPPLLPSKVQYMGQHLRASEEAIKREAAESSGGTNSPAKSAQTQALPKVGQMFPELSSSLQLQIEEIAQKLVEHSHALLAEELAPKYQPHALAYLAAILQESNSPFNQEPSTK